MSSEMQAKPISTLASTSRYGVIAVALLFAFGAAVQVFMAGLSVFDSAVYWDDHVFLGRMIGLLALLLPVLAIVGRAGRRIILLSATVTFLYVLQNVLANLDIGPVAALHALNAFPLMGIPIGVAMNTLGIVRGETNATPEASRTG